VAYHRTNPGEVIDLVLDGNVRGEGGEREREGGVLGKHKLPVPIPHHGQMEQDVFVPEAPSVLPGR
jgi:hypothetical protein